MFELFTGGGTHLLSPQVVQAVQRLQHPSQQHKGGAVLIRTPAGLTHMQTAVAAAGQSAGSQQQAEEPRDLSAKPTPPSSLPVSFLQQGQRPVAFVQQQPAYKQHAPHPVPPPAVPQDRSVRNCNCMI